MSKPQRTNIKRGSSKSGKPVVIPLKPLKESNRIDPQERLFMEAAERGDKATMIRCLLGTPRVNVNCTNMLGRSAIQIAVDNENGEIVELLLQQEGVKIGDALLYAIREGVYKIVEMLIDHPSITQDMLGTQWSRNTVSDDESNDYTPDISPVILAAHCNQFEILQLLLLRGATIEMPHQLSCSCMNCRKQVHEDSLRHSILRINTYKAIASPAWISLTNADPVMAAFKLSWELSKLALRENEFKDTYIEFSDQCKRYACDLLDQCRSSEEVITVLNKNAEDSDDEDDYAADSMEKLTLERLKLGLKYEQKQFVAHPHCQQLLTSIWYEGLPGWRKRNGFVKFLICVGLICIMPITVIYYLIFPRSKLGQLLRSPFMKFLYHSASFGIFLFLLVFSSTDQIDKPFPFETIRGPTPSPLEWLIVLYVTGFVWGECKQLWDEGLKAYMRQWWNWLDFIMLSLYLATFSLRTVAYFLINSGNYGPPYLERKDWSATDPTLISEGLFAVANVFSFSRIIFLFQANQHLGPLQISLGCMLIDIVKFLFIFFLVLTSFACGLNQLYWYYARSKTANSNDAFYTLGSSYITLFWSLFSLTQLKDIEIKDGHPYTQTMGEVLFIAYHAMSIIVLINMLIAMMSNSFQAIENHADMEWKFSRSKLWMGYFDEGSTLPPPFNIIISPKAVYYFFVGIYEFISSLLKHKKPRRKSMEGTIKSRGSVGPNDITVFKTEESGSPCNGIDESMHSRPHDYRRGRDHYEYSQRPTYNGDTNWVPLKHRRLRYHEVMKRLVSRLIHHTKIQLRQDSVNEDDLLEIKQDISSLRYELREDRKREAARSASNIDTLRRDIMLSFRGSSPVTTSLTHTDKVVSNNNLALHGTLLSQQEIEILKREIVSSLKSELREMAREIVHQERPNPFPNGPPHLPPIGADLYHTHLYTQL